MSGPARINLPALRQRTWPAPPRSRRGEQRLGQPMLPLQSGTGMLGVESRTPVVPVHIVRERVRGILPGSWRARVSVRFGAPLTFPPGASYIDATQAIEDAVKAL